MATLLEQVARKARDRSKADDEFRVAVVAAKARHSWAEIAKAAGMTRSGCQHIVRASTKGEN